MGILIECNAHKYAKWCSWKESKPITRATLDLLFPGVDNLDVPASVSVYFSKNNLWQYCYRSLSAAAVCSLTFWNDINGTLISEIPLGPPLQKISCYTDHLLYWAVNEYAMTKTRCLNDWASPGPSYMRSHHNSSVILKNIDLQYRVQIISISKT